MEYIKKPYRKDGSRFKEILATPRKQQKMPSEKDQNRQRKLTSEKLSDKKVSSYSIFHFGKEVTHYQVASYSH